MRLEFLMNSQNFLLMFQGNYTSFGFRKENCCGGVQCALLAVVWSMREERNNRILRNQFLSGDLVWIK